MRMKFARGKCRGSPALQTGVLFSFVFSLFLCFSFLGGGAMGHSHAAGQAAVVQPGVLGRVLFFWVS